MSTVAFLSSSVGVKSCWVKL